MDIKMDMWKVERMDEQTHIVPQRLKGHHPFGVYYPKEKEEMQDGENWLRLWLLKRSLLKMMGKEKASKACYSS